jgi:hypothetical protein
MGGQLKIAQDLPSSIILTWLLPPKQSGLRRDFLCAMLLRVSSNFLEATAIVTVWKDVAASCSLHLCLFRQLVHWCLICAQLFNSTRTSHLSITLHA